MPKSYVLFDRYVNIIAGTIQLNGLDAIFHIEKNLDPSPNRCELQIFNLSQENRKALHAQKEITVEISAGYRGYADKNNTNPDSEFLIFKGDLQQVFSKKDGPDWITTIRTADGIDSQQQSLVSQAFKKGTAFTAIAEQLLGKTSVDFKRALEKIKSGDIPAAVKTVLNSYTVQGSVAKELEKKFKEWGVKGFVSDGELQILKPGEFLGTEIIVLSPDTGLIGSPELDTSGYIRLTTLIRPEFLPGYAVNVVTAEYNGNFRIEKMSYNGTTFDNNWYIELEASPL